MIKFNIYDAMSMEDVLVTGTHDYENGTYLRVV